jgi:3-hydroxyisobutyrate dehydrogenase-like beta-hydroxyacid dehydrogenase
LPVTESVISQYAELMAEGFGDEDISAIYRLASKLFPDKFA